MLDLIWAWIWDVLINVQYSQVLCVPNQAQNHYFAPIAATMVSTMEFTCWWGGASQHPQNNKHLDNIARKRMG